jgi:hypothetical protein
VSEKEQIDHFAQELDKLVERFRSEYDLTYASVIGALTIKSHQLIDESND